jgi:metal-responsive CopG/Arc/MetJ family transcriptional regulator
MSKVINAEEVIKKQKAHEEMMRGLAGLAAYSSGASCMPQGYELQAQSRTLVSSDSHSNSNQTESSQTIIVGGDSNKQSKNYK